MGILVRSSQNWLLYACNVAINQHDTLDILYREEILNSTGKCGDAPDIRSFWKIMSSLDRER
jgi:hypothetical protein